MSLAELTADSRCAASVDNHTCLRPAVATVQGQSRTMHVCTTHLSLGLVLQWLPTKEEQ